MLEHEFILSYARTNPWEFAELKGLDWRYILNQAKFHNVAPLLYYNIKNLFIPSHILKEFEKIYTYTAFHNMLYLEELQKITENLNNRGIKIIILKGPMLAQEIYGNIALRPFIDMDILVKKEELDEIKSILYSMGYSTRNENFYKKYHFHMPYTKMGKMPIHLEIHWEFVDRFILNKIDMDRIWNGAKENKLPNEINILYLLLHIEKHAFFNKAIYNKENPKEWIFTKPLGNQLIWYTDIHEITLKGKTNFNNIIETAKEWCIQNIVYYNLYILNKLYPIPQLENLPKPQLGIAKRLIYNIAFSRKAAFKVHPDMQLRPIRIFDLANYLFPPINIIKRYYCNKKYIPAIIIYPLHIIKCSKEIVNEFLGICKETLSISKKKESPAEN